MKRQSGVALVMALLVLATVSILSYALLTRGSASRAAMQGELSAAQAREVAYGLEEWLGEKLRRDLNEREAVDSRSEEWAGPLPPLPFDRGVARGRITDLDGRFNINNVVRDGVVVPFQLRRLERLLLSLDLSERLGPVIADYVDADDTALPGGAEDQDYLSMRPPRRAANRPLIHTGELLYLRDMTPAIYAELLPHISALPSGTTLNVNTASPEVLAALASNFDLAFARELSNEGKARFASADQFLERVAQRRITLNSEEGQSLSVQSRYFELRAMIIVDDHPHAFSAVMQRSPERVRTISRSLGSGL